MGLLAGVGDFGLEGLKTDTQTAASSAVTASTAAVNAAVSIQEGKDMGPWDASANSPALSADASGVAVGAYYNVTVEGAAPFAGFNFGSGQTFAVGDRIARLGSQWYRRPFKISSGAEIAQSGITAQAIANRQVVVDSEKVRGVVIAPAVNISFTEPGTTATPVTVTVLAQLVVYDGLGGVRFIDATSVDVAQDTFLVLSGSASSYVDPNLKAKGASEKLFLFATKFNGGVLTNDFKSLMVLGVNRGGRFNTLHPTFSPLTNLPGQVLLKQPTVLTGFSGRVTIQDRKNKNFNFIVNSQVTLFDAAGGFRRIDPTTIALTENQLLVLSGSASSYVDPQLYVRGTGQSIFLLKVSFNAITATTHPNLSPVCTVLNGNFISYVADLTRNYQDERFTALELKGLLPKRVDMNSPVEGRIPNFVSKYRLRRQDVTIVLFDGSISTDMGYASKRADQSYRPPCCTETNIPSFIEEKLRWKGQQYRRYDAMTVAGGSTAVFTESGAGSSVQFDAAWDWQYPTTAHSGYNGLTRILSASGGVNPSVSYTFPQTNRRCDFVYRTDYLSSAALSVAIGGGSGFVQVYDEGSSSWIEANGYVFSAKEADQQIVASFNNGSQTATSLRKSIYQKRLKMRKVESDVATDRAVSITSTDGGRLGYWGIAYSPREFMFQFINSAKGSHRIVDLTNFEGWAVDYWKPDLVLYSCNTINEGAGFTPGQVTSNTPTAFAGRFESYINKMLAKSYAPDLMAYILFTSQAQGLLDANDTVLSTTATSYGAVTTVDYLDTLHAKLKSLPIASMSAFSEFYQMGKNRAAYYGSTMFSEMLVGSTQTGDTFVADNTHLNDYGAMIGWRFLERYFNF